MDSDRLADVPYEYAAIVPTGAALFTAGACPLDADGQVVGRGDHRAQAEQAVHNLQVVLSNHGAGPEHLLRTTIYVIGDREDLQVVWDIVSAALAPHRPPSTLLGVTALRYRDQLVEIDGIAALPS